MSINCKFIKHNNPIFETCGLQIAKRIVMAIIIMLFVGLFENLPAQNTLELYKRDYRNQNYNLEKQLSGIDSTQIYLLLADYKENYIFDSYISAGYDSIIISDTILNAYFTRGKKYYWSDINTDSVPDDLSRLLNRTNLEDSPINIFSLEELYENIINYYLNNGYPFAQVGLQDMDFNDSLFSGKIHIDKGKKYYFDSIIVKGEAKLKYHYLQNYLGLRKGSVFSMKKINEVGQLIRNLPFIEESNSRELAFIDNRADLILYLRNRRANQFNGMIGILPNNETTGKLLLTGDVNLILNNTLNSGELLSFKWQRYEQESQNLSIEVFYPYLLKSRFGTGFEFDMEKRDTSYLSTDLHVKFRYFTYADNGFDVFFQRFNSFLLTSTNISGDYANINSNMAGLSFKHVKLDNIFNPRKGFSFIASSAIGIRESSSSINDDEIDAVLHNRNRIVAAFYLPILNYFALKLKSKSAYMYSPFLYENELFRIGGLNTMRGFDELSISASGFTVNSVEFRYLFEENSAFFGFYDFGYYEKRFTNNNFYSFTHGIGTGINLQTAAGVFSLVYALGRHGDNSFDFNNSKIHIGYRNNF